MAKRDCSNSPQRRRGGLLPRGSCLKLRGRSWTYRRSIPPELRGVLGRSEITRSLVARLRDAVERLDFRKELAALTKPAKP